MQRSDFTIVREVYAQVLWVKQREVSNPEEQCGGGGGGASQKDGLRSEWSLE